MALILAWLTVTAAAAFAAVAVVLIHEWIEQTTEEIDRDIEWHLAWHEATGTRWSEDGRE